MLEQCLQDGDFRTLFIEHLGWDLAHGSETVAFQGETAELHRVAHKRGFLVFELRADRIRVQTRNYLRWLQTLTARIAHEHLLIVADHELTVQVWVWSYHDRQSGRWRCRFHPFFTRHIPPKMVDRIRQLTVSLDQEEQISLIDIIGKVRDTFDVKADQTIFFRRPKYVQTSYELACRMRTGGVKEFQEFVAFHQPLAVWFARRYKHLANHSEDLEQVAMLGVIRAAETFIPEKGAFSTYAVPAMKSVVSRYLPTTLPLGMVPVHLYLPYRHALAQRRKGLICGGPEAAETAYQEVVHKAPLRPELAVELHRFFTAVSLEGLFVTKPIQAIRVATTHQFSGIGDTTNPLTVILQGELYEMLLAAVEHLDRRSSEIIRRRYGIEHPESTLEQIGESLKLTRERVRQIEQDALRYLRKYLIETYLD